MFFISCTWGHKICESETITAVDWVLELEGDGGRLRGDLTGSCHLAGEPLEGLGQLQLQGKGNLLVSHVQLGKVSIHYVCVINMHLQAVILFVNSICFYYQQCKLFLYALHSSQEAFSLSLIKIA